MGQHGSRQSTVDELDALEDGVFDDDARELAVLKATIADSSTNEALHLSGARNAWRTR